MMRTVPPMNAPRTVSANADRLRASFDAPAPPTVGVEEELMLLDPDDARPRRRAPRGDRRARRRPPVRARAAGRAGRDRLPPRPVPRGARQLAAARGDLPPASAASCGSPAPACTRSRPTEGELNRGPAVRPHGRRSSARCARASSSSPCRSTSPSAAPIARSRSTTRCAPIFPSSPRSPRNAPFTPAAIPAWRRGARRLRAAAAPGRPAALRSWEALRPRTAPGRGPRPLVVGAAPAPPPRHARAARARHAGHRGGRGGGHRGRAGARRPPRRPPRCRRAAARPRHLAHRGERAERRAPRRGGRAARSRHGRARTHPRAPARPLDELEPVAERLGSAGELQAARRLVERNGAMALREASGGGPVAATRWLMERFTA